MKSMFVIKSVDPYKKEYCKENGNHFNKEAYEFVVSKMTSRDGKSVSPITVQELSKQLVDYNVVINCGELYDCCYVYSMAKSDFYGSSLHSEKDILLYVKDMIEDIDAPEGYIFNRWVADMKLKEEEIDWKSLV